MGKRVGKLPVVDWLAMMVRGPGIVSIFCQAQALETTDSGHSRGSGGERPDEKCWVRGKEAKTSSRIE